jgi:hypothetical protein
LNILCTKFHGQTLNIEIFDMNILTAQYLGLLRPLLEMCSN